MVKKNYADLSVHISSLLRPGTQDRVIAYWDGHCIDIGGKRAYGTDDYRL